MRAKDTYKQESKDHLWKGEQDVAQPHDDFINYATALSCN
jgi:hypothetical protein